MLLRVHFSLHTISSFGNYVDQANRSCSLLDSLSYSSSPLSLQLRLRDGRSHGAKSLLVSCKSNGGNLGGRPDNGKDRDDEYLEAFLLLSETIRHYHLRKQGFLEESQVLPFSFQQKESRAEVGSVGLGFLRRFQSPTIFLKIPCDGDVVLPILVGEFAIEKLIDSLRKDENGDCPNQYQFMRNLVEKLGYEVKMVRITKKVVNTYYARIYFSKPGEGAFLSVDARPSDAINVAKKCKVPIYVSKQIVLTDAIKIAYGTWKRNDAKSVYDVSLDSAPEGPDSLAEELDIVRSLNKAVKEERYKDAAMWRDKLTKLLASRHKF